MLQNKTVHTSDGNPTPLAKHTFICEEEDTLTTTIIEQPRAVNLQTDQDTDKTQLPVKSSSKPHNRQRCKYGLKCYNLQPEHRDKYRHTYGQAYVAQNIWNMSK
eukprot:TRINITY_DN22289_c0_g1_i1.p1 TRINITY_DN22289_c0_g1~~TRINITY_DN22289_c0_g1_i1.p1  ORF type:complete len:104 (+),score=2.35 TRINITY_DN22289_c0_g1_i1:57-368(+)